MGSSEENLFTDAARGARNAFERLLEEHTPELRKRLNGRIPQRFQAVLSVDDVLQQTFTDAFLHFDQFSTRPEGSCAGWLWTIAKNNLSNALDGLTAQKRGGDRRQVKRRSLNDSLAALSQLICSASNTPSQLAAGKEANAALARAIERLPDDYRCVVRMFDLENVPMQEVAQALGRSDGAAYMMRQRAHDLLGEYLGSPSRFLSTR